MSSKTKPCFRKVFEVTVEMDPIPWARARLAPIQDKLGNLKGVRPVTPKKQRLGRENFLKAIIKTKPKKPITGPIGLEILAFLAIPKSWPQYRKREARETIIRPETAPDWDNYGKFISDALQGIFYPDDKHIVAGGVSLFYSDQPRWEIRIYQWEV